jgi:hypothetical protein
MGDQRFHPVLWDGCLFRLLPKPPGDGLLQFTVMLEIFLDDGARRRQLQASSVFRGPRGIIVFSMFSRVLYEFWFGQMSLYPCRTSLYLYVYLYAP